jgi:hypothetical protein
MGIRDKVNEVETWVRIPWERKGAVATSRTTQDIPGETPWTKIVEISPRSGVGRMGKKVLLGKINGKRLELEVRQDN